MKVATPVRTEWVRQVDHKGVLGQDKVGEGYDTCSNRVGSLSSSTSSG